jgi:TonB-linked SusC/RagA family outer membrane protein
MKQKALLSVLLLLCFSFAWSQTRKVTGKITKENSTEALSGVSVTVKGSSTGTSTNNEGQFTITVPENKSVVLVFSSVGYKTREVSISTQTNVDVTLTEEASTLNDVVVIGYGTARKKDLAGPTASIGASQLEKIPVSSAAEAITGRLAGVQVTTTDGAPGAEIVIRVRGGGSVTQDNSPLYIVDGFPVGSINDIAPTDIATIDILKDASSAAIYGARGANGVVIITTKSAKAGKTVISYNGYGQARTLPNKLDVLSPYEFALAQYEYAKLRGQTDVDNFTKYFGVYDDLELYKFQKGTDWQEELFGNPAKSQQHNLSITGGTAKTKMSFSLANNTDEGLIVGSGYQRNYLNFKLNHEISNALKFDFSSRFTHTVVDGAGTSGSSQLRLSDAINTRPVNGLADQIVLDPNSTADDNYEDFLKSMINPLDLAAQDYRKRTNKALNLNTAVSWSIIKDLVLRSEGGFDINFGQNRRYYGPLTGESRNVGLNLPLGEITNTERRGYRLSNTLNYLKAFGRHDFNFLLGQELVGGELGFTEFDRRKVFPINVTPEIMFDNMALGTADRHTTFKEPGNKLSSFFGRVIYQLDNKYIFQLIARADGSSRFAQGNQWGFFPSASFAWKVSQEDFMENLDMVSDLKLRLSYGEAGNNRIDANLFRAVFALSDNRPIGMGNVGQTYYTYNSNLLPNPDIKWETTVTRNAGLDFGFWRNKLAGSVDFYYNTTKDLLVESDIPQYLGFSKQMRNIGQTSNRGIELALNGNIISKKDLQVSATFNIGFNRSKIDKLDGVNEKAFNSNWAGTDLKTQDDYRVIVGQTVGLMYGYVTDGFYTTDDFSAYNPSASRPYVLKPGVADVGAFMGGISVRPGVLKLRDLDGDGVITPADRTIIGKAQPKHSGGFGLNATYKGFDVAGFFNWVYGTDIYNTGKIAFNMLYRTTYGNMLNTVNSDNRYKYIDESGNLVTDLESLAKLNANASIWSPFSMGTASPVFHSYAVEDGSFLRLNNVTLGYSLPKNLISRLRMTKFRVYGTVYNAFLWTNYTGYDPEVTATRNSSYSALTPGVDYSAYPKSRNYTVGVNVTF